MLVRLAGQVVLGISFLFSGLSWASSQEPYVIAIKGHQFSPSTLIIPVGQKIKLTVDNQDSTVEEFESFDLNREKIVSGNRKIFVFIGPLKQGTYKYFGDFHQKTAQGIIVAQ